MKKFLVVLGILIAMFVSLIVAVGINETLFLVLFLAYFFAICAAVIIGIRKLVKKMKPKKVKATATKQKAEPQTVQQKKTVQRSTAVPLTYDEKPLSYEYSDVGLYVPDLSVMEGIKVGDLASIESEPENEFDPGAVAVYVYTPGKNEGMTKVGYLYRGRLQNMANDWIKNDRHNFCIISYIDLSVPDAKKNGVKIDISFYN